MCVGKLEWVSMYGFVCQFIWPRAVKLQICFCIYPYGKVTKRKQNNVKSRKIEQSRLKLSKNSGLTTGVFGCMMVCFYIQRGPQIPIPSHFLPLFPHFTLISYYFHYFFIILYPYLITPITLYSYLYSIYVFFVSLYYIFRL